MNNLKYHGFTKGNFSVGEEQVQSLPRNTFLENNPEHVTINYWFSRCEKVKELIRKYERELKEYANPPFPNDEYSTGRERRLIQVVNDLKEIIK